MKTISLAVLAVLLAGCVNVPDGPSPTDGSSSTTSYPENTFGVGARSVANISGTLGAEAAQVVLTGFAHFGIYSPAISELYPPATFGDVTSRLEAKLAGVSTGPHTLGFLIDENLLAAFGKQGESKFGFVRENGALVVVSGSSPSDGISYLRVEGQAYDLFAFMGESPSSGFHSMPLVVAHSVNALEPHAFSLEQLHADFGAIVGDGAVIHVQTQGVAFGTTSDNLAGTSSAVDAGLYEVFAPYYDAPGPVTAVRVGMGAIWMGTGQEYLGLDVTIDGFLVNEEALRDAAKSRSIGLAEEAQRSLPQVSQAGTLKNPWTQNLQNERIPGFLLAYKITPTNYQSPPGLADLYASKPGGAHEATAPVALNPANTFGGNFENRIVGAGLKEICGCQSPYDLGIYLLATFVWDGSSENFTIYAVPVLYPTKGIARPLTGERVRIEAVYSKYDVARTVLAEKAHLRFDTKPWGKAILAFIDQPTLYGNVVDVKVLDGFLWANSITIVPPTSSSAPVLLLPPQASDITSSSVALSWFWPHENQTTLDYHVYASTNPLFVPSQVTQKAGDLTQESYTVGGLSGDTWYFKVRAWSGASFSPSNRVLAPAGSAPTLNRVTPSSSSTTATTGNGITFHADARDADGDLDRTNFYLGGAYQDFNGCYAGCTYDDASWSYTFNSAGTFVVSSQAVDTAGHASSWVNWSITVSSPSPTPPASPTLYSVTRCTDDPKHCLRVDWSRYEGTGFQRYEVYRAVSGGAWSLRSTITNFDGDEIRDEGLTCGTTYSYYVRVVTNGGSANSGSLGETPRGPAGYC